MKYNLAAMVLVVLILGSLVAKEPPKASGPGIPLQKESDQELHVLVCRGGVVETDGKIHGPRSFVEVDRPGKRVTLVLATTAPLTWHVKLSEGTVCERVILAGIAKQAIEGLPADVPVEEETYGKSKTPVLVAFQVDSLPFRALVRQLKRRTDLTLSSFQSAGYNHKTGPIQIDQVQADPRFAVEYPQPASPTELPRIEFQAHLYNAPDDEDDDRPSVETSYGAFTLTGPQSSGQKPLPKGVRRVTLDPATGKHYGIRGHEMVEIDLGENKVVEMDMGLDVPELSWPCEVTFDTKRKRVILGSSAGGGYLYAYDTQTKKWSVLGKRPGSVDAFAYSAKDDCIYGVHFGGGEDERPRICRISPDGVMQERVALQNPIVPGSLSTGPGVCTTQVAISGEHVMVLSAPSEHRGHGWYIYLVDPKTGKVTLTFKQLK